MPQITDRQFCDKCDKRIKASCKKDKAKRDQIK